MAKAIKIDSSDLDRVSQGDIFRNVEFIEYVIEKDGNIEVSKIQFPLVLVLSQDCDLNQDHFFRNCEPPKPNQDKRLMSVLVAPIYNLEHFLKGEHLSEIKLPMQNFKAGGSKTKIDLITKNEIPRYHHLIFPKAIKLVDSIIDFKHYFSVNVKYITELKNDSFVGKIDKLYREDISHRFSSFLARIGLPE